MIVAAAGDEWFGTDLETLAFVALSAVAIYATVIVLVRLVGLRSFSEMSAFDFAMTVAIGTIIATTALSAEVSLPVGAAAALALFATQTVIAILRARFGAGAYIDNTPLVLIRDGEIDDDHLRQARMTRDDLAAKLRERGVARLAEVKLAVIETTGDVSVIQAETQPELDPFLLSGVEE